MARDYDLPDRNVQNATLLAIIDRDYRPTLPPIHPDTWERIVKGTTRGEVDLNERLEFVGDALLYICVALELRKLYPESMPHFLTVRSSANLRSSRSLLMLSAIALRLTFIILGSQAGPGDEPDTLVDCGEDRPSYG